MNDFLLLDYMPKTKEYIEANKTKPSISDRVKTLETTVNELVESQSTKSS